MPSRTRKAGSSRANCDLEPAFKGKEAVRLRQRCAKLIVATLITFPVVEIPVDFLWRDKEVDHLPDSKFKIHLLEVTPR
jgi:hypothetical protein